MINMPGGDRTGPPGRDMGRGNLNGNRAGVGPGGECVCPQCGVKLPHQVGTPCYSVSCPKCQTKMIRA